VNAPLGGEKIDFNLLYAEAMANPPLVSNWGNLILVLLILGTAAAFLGTVWSWEGWGRTAAGWIERNVAPVPRALAAAAERSDGSVALDQALANHDTGQIGALLDRKPELRGLLPKLMNLSPDTLAALDTILADPDRGAEILTAIGRVDGEVIATLRQIGDRDRNLLLALVKGI
jgi:hypothetical protein